MPPVCKECSRNFRKYVVLNRGTNIYMKFYDKK